MTLRRFLGAKVLMAGLAGVRQLLKGALPILTSAAIERCRKLVAQ
jgi:hypothetical protein